MTEEERDQPAVASPKGRRLTRRRFIQTTGAAGVGAAAPVVIGSDAAAAEKAAYPVKPIIALDELSPGTTIPFTYPDDRSPALLLRMSSEVLEGVGPDASIVAFSSLCTHKGCPVSYRPEHRLLICPCHWSTFDPEKAGGLVIGQASHGLPRIELRVESGMVVATGVEGLIYGRHTNLV
ncbi:MAG: arsenate reductase (azurin) small subunit [Chromatiales bacterium]|nr:arsenate reductase (azurin) small subunit [Chromatiales bacterium]